MTEISYFDHPAQPNWYLRGIETLHGDTEVPEDLLRFGEDQTDIMHAIKVAVRQANGGRATFEQGGVSKLLLTSEELAQYRRFAGDPESLADYVLWYGEQATNAFARILRENGKQEKEHARLDRIRMLWGNSRQEAQKIAVELGGATLSGAWSGAANLDSAIDATLAELGKRDDTEVESFVDRQHPKMLTYTIKPLRGVSGTNKWNGKFMTVQRQRVRADILRKGMLIELFRKSIALIPLDYVDEETREQLMRPFLEAKSDKELAVAYAKNSPPALVGGRIFEHAIENRAKTKEAIALNAQHIMQVRTPDELVEKLYGPGN